MYVFKLKSYDGGNTIIYWEVNVGWRDINEWPNFLSFN